jgi:preprotein translocase subunit SecE
VARERQRAADRKRRAREAAGETPLHGDEQPINASGEVDEFDAALIAGAAADGGDGTVASDEELDAAAMAATPPADVVEDEDEDEDEGEDDVPVARRGAGAATLDRPRPGQPTTTGGGPRFLQFLRASWAELQRVQWPDRRQVAQATAVVIGFVIIAGLYLGVADYVAQKIVDFIL